MSSGAKLLGAALAGATLVVAGLVVWKTRSHHQPVATTSAETGSSVPAQPSLPAAAPPSDPGVVGSWRNVHQSSKSTITATMTLGADGHFEQVLEVPPGRIVYRGRYLTADGGLTFAQESCRVEGESPFPNACDGSVSPASYVVDKDTLTLTTHRPAGDQPATRFDRVPTP